MRVVKIFEITITSAYYADNCGTFYSYSEFVGDRDTQGYDDGGRQYLLPEGYCYFPAADCVLDQYGNEQALGRHSSGLPQLSYGRNKQPVLKPFEGDSKEIDTSLTSPRKNKQYLVVVGQIDVGMGCVRVNETWVETKRTLNEAEEAANILAKSPGTASVAVIEWEPGNADKGYMLKHGDCAGRNVGGGIPNETLIMMGRRTLAWKKGRSSPRSDGYGMVWQVLTDWEWESVEGVEKLDMSPRKPSRRLGMYMLEDRPNNVFFPAKAGDEVFVDQVLRARTVPGTGSWSKR